MHLGCGWWTVAVALAGAPALLGQTEGDLRMEFERKRVRLKINMPATSKGVDIFPGKKPPINNYEVVEECRIAFLEEIEARNIARAQIDLFEVPGSFEIPLHAQLLAKTRRYTAIVAAGLVVDGGIYRHEFVADTVIKALMDVQLRTEVPVFSAVLTPQQFHESAAHFEFFRKHFATKGIEVAEACANTLLSLERLRGQVAAGIT